MNALPTLAFTLFFCFSSFLGHTQDVKQLQLTGEVDLSFDRFIGVDQFGYIYYLTNNVLYKAQKEQPPTQQFQAFALGELTRVDLTNPLKITLYYETANTAIVLDNRLNELERINFSQLQQTMTTTMVASSRAQQFWVVDMNGQVLHQFDYKQRAIVNSSLPLKPSITNYANAYNYFFYATATSIYAHNVYGNLVFQLNLEQPISVLSFSYPHLLYGEAKDFKVFNIETKLSSRIDFTNIPYQDVFLNDENFYIYDGKKLKTYQITD